MMRYTFALAGFTAMAIGNPANAQQRAPVWVPLAPASGTVSSIAVSLGPAPLLLAATDQGVFRSTDGGVSWGATSFDLAVKTVAIDPRRPSVAYAWGILNGDQLLWSTDAGAHWWPKIFGPFFIQAIAFDPVASDRVYLAMNEDIFIPLDSHWNGILARSTDAGASWGWSMTQQLENEMVTSVAAGPSEAPGGSRLFAGVTVGGPAGRSIGLLRSSDGGDSWAPVNGVLQDLSIYSVAPDKHDPAVVAVVVNAGSFAPSPRVVYRSTDGGETWSTSSSLLDGRFISQILPDPTRLHVFYAATDDGVYISTDAAGSWSPLGHGLGGRLVTMLATSPDGPAIYAVTADGVFVLENDPVDPVTPRSPVPVSGR